MTTQLLTKRDIAEAFDVSVNTVNHWVAVGYGPPSAKIGRRRVWRRSDVDRWLEAQFEAQVAVSA